MIFFDNFFILFSNYHHNRVSNYLKKLNLKELIDVGAHKGEFLSYVIKINSIKKFYVFEPQSKIFNILRKNFSKNRKIKLVNKGLSKKPSNNILYINKLSSTSTMSKFNKSSNYLKFKKMLTGSKKNYIDKYLIKTSSINNFFKNIKLKNCLLKIDVEGFEYNVLQGSENKMDEIKYILIEDQFGNQYKNKNFNEIKNYLYKKKFKVLKKFIFPTLHYQDVIFKKFK